MSELGPLALPNDMQSLLEGVLSALGVELSKEQLRKLGDVVALEDENRRTIEDYSSRSSSFFPLLVDDPTTPQPGQVWFNTTSQVPKIVNGAGVVKTFTIT